MKKKVNRKYIIARLWKYICRYKGLAAAAVFLTITSNVLALIGPALSGEAVNAVEPGQGAVDFHKVFFYCAVMAVIYALSAILSYILSRVMIRLSRNIVLRMRKDVFDKLMDLPVGYFDSHHTGDIISRISYDIDTVNASLSNDLLQICTSVITVVGSFIGMLLRFAAASGCVCYNDTGHDSVYETQDCESPSAFQTAVKKAWRTKRIFRGNGIRSQDYKSISP